MNVEVSITTLAALSAGLLVGFATRECYAWGAPAYAPFDGEIVEAVDDMPEHAWIHPVREGFTIVKNGLTFTRSRLQEVMGNHVIVRGERVFAAFAHLAPGTVAVSSGQKVRTGDLLGRVGHTGNSAAPHLHFQLMEFRRSDECQRCALCLQVV